MESFQKDKILGPHDEWTIDFYLGLYDLMEEDILKVVEESKLPGYVLTTINSTFFALIPRKDDPNYFKEFMPILYVIPFIKSFLKSLEQDLGYSFNTISEEKFGLLRNRQIHDAIWITQEALHSIKTKKTQAMMIK